MGRYRHILKRCFGWLHLVQQPAWPSTEELDLQKDDARGRVEQGRRAREAGQTGVGGSTGLTGRDIANGQPAQGRGFGYGRVVWLYVRRARATLQRNGAWGASVGCGYTTDTGHIRTRRNHLLRFCTNVCLHTHMYLHRRRQRRRVQSSPTCLPPRPPPRPERARELCASERRRAIGQFYVVAAGVSVASVF